MDLGVGLGKLNRTLEVRWGSPHLGLVVHVLCLCRRCFIHWLRRRPQGVYYTRHSPERSLKHLITQNKPSLVRTYRDWSIADFSFTLISTIIGAYGCFQTSVRAGMCQFLETKDELMRDLVEMGLSVENCEPWIERAAMGFVTVSLIVLVARVSPYFCR